jgi:formylglycine-generating enzyme required for sulfatase activity
MRGGAWPDDFSHEVDSRGFLGQLRAALDGTPKIDLPTEAQWEYACRAKSTTDWYNGYNCTSASYDAAPANLKKMVRYSTNHGYGPDGKIIGNADYAATLGTSNGTARVGSYLPNAWGLYDMTGNVWEWCLDAYAGFTSEDQTEPTGPAGSSSSKRVLRSGAITSPAFGTRTAVRLYKDPWYVAGAGAIGFRLCLTVSE